jgi:predicted transcriptional regulator
LVIVAGAKFTEQDAPLVRAFMEVGLSEQEARKRLYVVDKDLVEELRVEMTTKLPRPKALMLKASIDACEVKTPLTPKIDIRELKQAKTKENAEKKHR